MSELSIPDQRALWDRKHGENIHAEFRDGPCTFGTVFEAMLEPGSVIHEIACGVGGDALYFAQKGHTVVASDISRVVLEQNKKLDHPNLHFVQADTAQGLPIRDEACDALYANLALHYFDDATTENIFKDIARVLKPGGLFAFACKSLKDPDFGNGTEIEPNFFLSDKGHLRHFFSAGYIHDLTDGTFVMEKVEEVAEVYVNPVSFIYAIGRKINTNEYQHSRIW